MHRTGATHLVPGSRAGDEPKQIEDLGDGDSRPDFRVTNARHDGDLPGSVGRNPRLKRVLRPRAASRTEKRNPYVHTVVPDDGPWHVHSAATHHRYVFPCAPTTIGLSPAPSSVR